MDVKPISDRKKNVRKGKNIRNRKQTLLWHKKIDWQRYSRRCRQNIRMFFYHSNIRTKFITFGCWPHQIIIDFLSKTKNVSSVIDNQQHLTKKKEEKTLKEFSNDNRIRNVFFTFFDDDNDHDDERWPPSSKFLIFFFWLKNIYSFQPSTPKRYLPLISSWMCFFLSPLIWSSSSSSLSKSIMAHRVRERNIPGFFLAICAYRQNFFKKFFFVVEENWNKISVTDVKRADIFFLFFLLHIVFGMFLCIPQIGQPMNLTSGHSVTTQPWSWWWLVTIIFKWDKVFWLAGWLTIKY